jgi:UDP-glucose 4-epimerase
LRLIDLARLLVEVHGGGGIELTPFPPERQSIDIGDYAGDYSKFRAASGWAPTVPLRDGLARTFAFYEEHGPHYR